MDTVCVTELAPLSAVHSGRAGVHGNSPWLAEKSNPVIENNIDQRQSFDVGNQCTDCEPCHAVNNMSSGRKCLPSTPSLIPTNGYTTSIAMISPLNRVCQLVIFGGVTRPTAPLQIQCRMTLRICAGPTTRPADLNKFIIVNSLQCAKCR